MLEDVKVQLQSLLSKALSGYFEGCDVPPDIEVEVPADKSHGEFASNIALKSARILRRAPMQIAEEFLPAVQDSLKGTPLEGRFSKIQVERPGFINFYLAPSALYEILHEVFEQGDDYGRSSSGKGRKILIEFVSANPTGPLSVAHARQAAVGDALARILKFTGCEVTREYYVNDEGNQINLLGRSIFCRALEQLRETVEFPENGYQGDYIRDMAQVFMEQRGLTSVDQVRGVADQDFCRFGVDYLMGVIRRDLEDFGVHFDEWSHQSELASEEKILPLLEDLQGRGFTYEKEGALWFQTTRFGDDKDRVLKKSDGSYTYFTPDIVYHKNKYGRGFTEVVNIWGPDHHGYIPRLTAAVEALGFPRESLRVLIVQLASIYKDGQPLLMSTRRGQFISLREVLDEVGSDAARYFFLLRHINAQLDFDLDVAKKETPENPVYYIQYGHARIHSIVAKARREGMDIKAGRIENLKEEEELDLMKKIASFPDVLVQCTKEMDPFALVSYLLDLANCFHKFYDRHRVVDPDRPVLSAERLALIDAVRIVLANGLRLLGITAPQKMVREE